MKQFAHKSNFFTVCLSVVLFFISCGSVGTVQVPPVKVGPADVVNVVLVNPYTEIMLLENKQEAAYSEPLSYASGQLIKEAIWEQKFWIPVTDTTSIKGDSIINTYKSFLRSVMVTKEAERYYVPVPSELDSLIESTGHRFGMIVWGTGFERSKGNQRKAEALSLAVGILTAVATMGTAYYVSTPYEGALTLNAVIIDTRDDCVVYHNSVSATDKKPTDYSTVNSLVKKLFSDYYSPGYQLY